MRVQTSRKKNGGAESGEERSLTSNIIAIAMRTSEIALGIDHNYRDK